MTKVEKKQKIMELQAAQFQLLKKAARLALKPVKRSATKDKHIKEAILLLFDARVIETTIMIIAATPTLKEGASAWAVGGIVGERGKEIFIGDGGFVPDKPQMASLPILPYSPMEWGKGLDADILDKLGITDLFNHKPLNDDTVSGPAREAEGS